MIDQPRTGETFDETSQSQTGFMDEVLTEWQHNQSRNSSSSFDTPMLLQPMDGDFSDLQEELDAALLNDIYYNTAGKRAMAQTGPMELEQPTEETSEIDQGQDESIVSLEDLESEPQARRNLAA